MPAGLSCALTHINLLANNTTVSSAPTPLTPRQVVKRLSYLDIFPYIVLLHWEEGSRPLLAYIADLVAEPAQGYLGHSRVLFFFLSPVQLSSHVFLGVSELPEHS